MSKRVLVISYIALMSATPNGRTMKSLLEGVEKDDIALFCCSGMPDFDSCATAYKVTNKNALHSIFSASKGGGEIEMLENSVDVNPFMDARKGSKKAWKYFAKEIVWRIGRWKKRALEWVADQHVDYIVYMYGDTPSLQNFAVEVSKKFGIPLLVYSCEDYCFKDYNYIDFKKHSPFFKIYSHSSKKATQRLFEQANGLITNSDMLGRAYTGKYGVKNIETIMMASNMKFKANYDVKNATEASIVYAGAIGKYRVDALVDIANALGEVDDKLYLSVYGRTDDKAILEKFSNCKHLKYNGFVPYEKVLEIMYSGTLLIEAINQDEYVEKDKKFGFSTKYADCFACGTPLMVYAPQTIVETEFAAEHKCAFVSVNKDSLVNTLRTALFDAEQRKSCVMNAQIVTEKYFNKENNIIKYNQIASKIFDQEK